MSEQISVEVSFALPSTQYLVSLLVAPGISVQDAIAAASAQIPVELPPLEGNVGIFSKFVALDHPLMAGDRVEIYRPLIVDPKDQRRARAKQSPLKSRRTGDTANERKK
jgi:uncharacterized protein